MTAQSLVMGEMERAHLPWESARASTNQMLTLFVDKIVEILHPRFLLKMEQR
jgi:hypothetical protein